MTTVLAVLVAVAALAAVLTGALGLGLGRSDPAGNGLAIAWVTVATLATALLVLAALLLAAGIAPRTAAGVPATVAGITLAPALAFALLRAQAAPRVGRRVRAALAGLGTAAWLGLLLHAAARGQLWPLPDAVAGIAPGLLAAAGIATALAATAFAARGVGGGAMPFAVVFPALVLRDGEAVHVVRDADALAALDPAVFTRDPTASTIDANGTVWTLRPAARFAAWTAQRAGALPFAAVRDRVLALPRLHAERAQDAELRRLVAMQTNVTALTFVLPR